MPRAKTPAAEYKKLMLRLPEDLLQFVQQSAEDSHRSMNAQILHVLLEWKTKERHAARRTKKD
jgi:hypothetical protein